MDCGIQIGHYLSRSIQNKGKEKEKGFHVYLKYEVLIHYPHQRQPT